MSIVEEARAFGESFSAAKLGLDGAEGMQEFDGLRIGFLLRRRN